MVWRLDISKKMCTLLENRILLKNQLGGLLSGGLFRTPAQTATCIWLWRRWL